MPGRRQLWTGGAASSASRRVSVSAASERARAGHGWGGPREGEQWCELLVVFGAGGDVVQFVPAASAELEIRRVLHLVSFWFRKSLYQEHVDDS